MPKSSRIILKFDHEDVASAFRMIWNPSLAQFVQHINEMVNRNGTPCDLHVEQTAGNEYQFRHKSGNKGVVLCQSNDDIGVKLIDYDSVPLRTKYILQTPQGFILMVKTGDVDTKLEVLSGPVEDLKEQIEEHEARVIEARQEALKRQEEEEANSEEPQTEAEPDPALVNEDGSAKMEVNQEEETEPQSEEDETTEG